MGATRIIDGLLKPDGTLELARKPDLPPGQVRVTLEAIEPAAPQEDVWSYLERVWAENRERGFRGRSKEEIDAEIDAMRDEWEERQREIERLQDDSRRQGDGPRC